MIKAVLFDVDGTILDTDEFVFSAVDYTLKKYHLKVSKKTIRAGAGRNLFDYYKFILPKEDYLMLGKIHAKFQEDKHYLIRPFPGVVKVFEKLKEKGIKLAVVSNRQRDSLVKSLRITGIFKYFEAVVSAEDVEHTKPHKDHTLKALEMLGVNKNEAVMVGDSEHDILSAKSAGVKTVGITHGWFGKAVEKSKPDYLVNNLDQLLAVLTEL